MFVHLIRFHAAKDDTLGALFIGRSFVAVTVEDEYRAVKVYGETCIPEGIYKLGLRYSPKFTPRLGHDMIEIKDVPNFKYILIHPGNTEEDTAGCLLVGNVLRFNPDGTSRVEESRLAYQRVYNQIAPALKAGESVFLSISFIGFPPE